MTRYLAYFLLGGTTVCLVTWFAGHARGLVAAMLATFPVVTLTTFLTVSREAGTDAVVSYARGMVLMCLPWLAYVLCVIVLAPRIGTGRSLAVGLALYAVGALALLLRGR